MLAFVTSTFTALANIKAIAGYIDEFAGAVVIWYVQRQKSETLTQISDAAALAARADTDEARYEAAQKWKDALSRNRVTAS